MKKKIAPIHIDPNEIKTRDPAQLAIIQGQVKAGIHKDQKKEAAKKKCRKKRIDPED